MVEDAHQVVVLVSGSSDLLALIHGGLPLSVAPLCPGRTLGQSVRNSRLAVPALVVETCLQALEASLTKPEEDGHRCVTSGNERLCNRLTALCSHARIAVRRGPEVTTDRVARALPSSPPCRPSLLLRGRPSLALSRLAWAHLKAMTMWSCGVCAWGFGGATTCGTDAQR